MKIWAMSDLHLEFFDFSPPQVEADVVVLAGDIHSEHHGLAWARRAFPYIPIVYVLGNHEFYDAHYESVLESVHKKGAEFNISVLECNDTIIGGVRFLGTTLWTDFEIDVQPDGTAGHALWYANRGMTDFHIIRYRSGLLRAEDSRELHHGARRWLSDRLSEPFSGKTVVVTHHLPHRHSINPMFHRHPLNPAFASHMPDLVCAPVDLWIHGHTHCSVDYVTDGTRVLCNPRGYGPHDLNPKFEPGLVVEP